MAGALTAAVLGSSEDLEAGSAAMAIGATTDGKAAVSTGVISSLRVRLDAGDESLHGLIKTDAPTEPSWSGGPLVDATGAVIGITTDLGGDGARFGFPEVMLGLHPGLGGTARFTQLVNPMQAMPLMLTGKTIDARKARSLGLVDAVAEERHVRNAVRDAIFGRLKRAKPGPLNRILNLGPVRGLLARRMRAEAGAVGRAGRARAGGAWGGHLAPRLGIGGERVLEGSEARLDLDARRMLGIGRHRIEQLLEPADELVEDLLVHELRQPPRALLVNLHANHHAILGELAAAELHELIDDAVGALAGGQHLEHGGHGAVHGHFVERGAHASAERAT